MSQNGDGKIIVLFGSVKKIKMKNKKSLAQNNVSRQDNIQLK
jgi:hypothetical protein